MTFDLSPYRGQQVSLTFEADNCVPGGHFAYAYFAIRNDCAGLQMNGDTLACANSIAKYYVPSLDSASYNWFAPPGWIIQSDSNSNAITLTVGPQSGYVVVRSRTAAPPSLTASLYSSIKAPFHRP